jgi:uncharacterized protein YbjT (DUF2867 family)
VHRRPGARKVDLVQVILTGATGFVGSTVLDHLLARPDIARVTCLTDGP